MMTDADHIRILLELIDALDRRLPQVEHVGEADIAREAAALRASALERVAALEHKLASV
jgi:hypothetical protein